MDAQPSPRTEQGTTHSGRGWVAWVVAAALCVAPLGFISWLIDRRSVDVPYSDEWALVHLVQRQAAGVLRLSDLWAQHNEHRHFFSQLILVEMARFTRWNLRWELVANLVVAVGILALILVLLRSTLRPLGTATFLVAAVLTVWLFLSPVQWENWLSGWQLAWFLGELAAVASIAVLWLWPETKPGWVAVVLGILLGFLASYSLASGLFVWPAAAVVIVGRPRLRPWLPAWVLAGLAAFGIYLIGYHHPQNSPPLTALLHHPVNFVLFLLAYMGTAVWGRQRLAVVAGIGVGALFAAACGYLLARDRTAFKRAAPWVAVTVYALLAELETAIARVGFGVSQATASRYATPDILLLVATLVFGLLALHSWSTAERLPSRTLRLVRVGLAVLAVAAVARSYIEGVDGSRVYQAVDLQGQACMAMATQADHGCLDVLAANQADAVYADLQYLRTARLDHQHPIPGR